MLWVLLLCPEKTHFLLIRKNSFFKTLFFKATLVVMVRDYEFHLITLLIFK